MSSGVWNVLYVLLYVFMFCVLCAGVVLFVVGITGIGEAREMNNQKRAWELSLVSCFGLFMSGATLHAAHYFLVPPGGIAEIFWFLAVITDGAFLIVLTAALMRRYGGQKPRSRPPFGPMHY